MDIISASPKPCCYGSYLQTTPNTERHGWQQQEKMWAYLNPGVLDWLPVDTSFVSCSTGVQIGSTSPTCAETMVQEKQHSTATQTHVQSKLVLLLAWSNQIQLAICMKPVRDHVPVAALVIPTGWSVYSILFMQSPRHEQLCSAWTFSNWAKKVTNCCANITYSAMLSLEVYVILKLLKVQMHPVLIT